MGEARRRKGQHLGPNMRSVTADDPEVRTLLEKGQVIAVHMFGVGAIDHAVRSLTYEQLMAPERHTLRMAFETLDRIRTGEINPWECFLCHSRRSGMQRVSVMAVIERALGEPLPDKPGIIVPVCHACDNVSAEDTRKRVEGAFHLSELQEGRA